jgi:hypothetical protein
VDPNATLFNKDHLRIICAKPMKKGSPTTMMIMDFIMVSLVKRMMTMIYQTSLADVRRE